MVCANPDKVVQRGERLIWCGGALAELYASLGGAVEMAGKPHRPIYDLAFGRLASADPPVRDLAADPGGRRWSGDRPGRGLRRWAGCPLHRQGRARRAPHRAGGALDIPAVEAMLARDDGGVLGHGRPRLVAGRPMRIVQGWRSLAPDNRGAAVALGNFDGVHLGHQQVIAAAGDAARRLGAPLGVISFEPHARMHFQPDSAPFRLMRPAQLARALAALGADRLYLLPFGSEMAALSDEAFARDVLVAGLGARHVAVGFDITFGKGRSGDPAAMAVMGRLRLRRLSRPGLHARRREGLLHRRARGAAARRARARRPPARPSLRHRGGGPEGPPARPAARLPNRQRPLGRYVAPRFGVYAVRARLADGRLRDGVANIGVNPTTGEVAPRLEAWLFEFDEAIYGEVSKPSLIAFLRPEERFASVDAMTAQVRRDADDARAILPKPIRGLALAPCGAQPEGTMISKRAPLSRTIVMRPFTWATRLPTIFMPRIGRPSASPRASHCRYRRSNSSNASPCLCSRTWMTPVAGGG